MTPYPFSYSAQGELFCESIAVSSLAQEYGSPLFVYSKARLEHNISTIKEAATRSSRAWDLSYAVKANSNPVILQMIASAGFGASVVSGGELLAALKAGFPAEQISFDGPGKTRVEIELAIIKNIKAIVVESQQELELIASIASTLGTKAKVMIRVNPHVDAKTHPYISTGLLENKFGIDINDVPKMLAGFHSDMVSVIGLHMHIGSQLLDIAPYVEAARSIRAVTDLLRTQQGLTLSYLNLGGGQGIQYHNVISDQRLKEHSNQTSDSISFDEFFTKTSELFEGLGVKLCIEPGRAIVGDSCVLLSEVLYTKANPKRTFAIVDAAMNDLIRPSLYKAYHQIVPANISEQRDWITTSIVGPICETGDFFALDRTFYSVRSGEYIAICCAGAYGFVLSSNYNLRPRAAEVLVDGDSVSVIRRRQTIEEII